MRDITLGITLYPKFTTRAFATGIPTVLAGTPVVSIYEDANLTQITAGVTLGVDHDGVVGFNMVTIVATGANGFENGKEYQAVITTGTVSGVSVVGEVVAEFSIGQSAAGVQIGTAGVGLTNIGTIATCTTVTNQVTANMTAVSGDATAADNLELDYDGTGYAKPNSTIGTCTTNTDMLTVASILTTAMTEAYNTDGSAPTLAQALHLIIAYLMERSVSGTTVTANQLDGSTSAATFTLNSATTPTSITRAS